LQSNNQLLSDSAFFALRFVLAVILLSAIFLVIRRAIVVFVGQRAQRLGRRKYVLVAANAVILALSLWLSEPLPESLEGLGRKIGRMAPVITPDWTGGFLVGLFYTYLALLFLLLLIQIVGAVFWFFESRLIARSGMRRHETGAGGAASVYVLKALSFVNRASRTTILVVLIVAFGFELFTFFRGTAPVVDTFTQSLGTPARTVAQAILGYLPNLGYLAVIGGLGWALVRLVRFTFHSIGDGSLNVPGFLPEWSGPTYKLVRFVVLLFLLMVSFPYLPGAGSQFFQGFSVFIGALVTFGSTGAISNIVSGITLTYTNAFQVGDFVRIGETVGFVRARSLLVTRIVTNQNETVTIPNGNILSTSILNYTCLAASKGLALTVNAGIGYDVDWRTVQRLMIEGARRTENVLSDPPPCVWQTNLGDYAVFYQLRAWTARADLVFETHSDLRANVLDTFNRAGVEIMTPSIFAHRDASGLAIPQEQFADRPVPRGIAVDVKTPQSSAAALAQGP
jgi:small-conductance mechanosensitive channel